MEILEQLDMEEIQRRTASFLCPCCKTKLQFNVGVKIREVGLADTVEEIDIKENRPPNPITLRKKERVEKYGPLLARAKELGVFQAFEIAIDTARAVVNNREDYFLLWLERITQQKTPQFALRQCLLSKDLSANGQLSLWGFQDISAVFSDGELKTFIPKKLINGEAIQGLAQTANGIQVRPSMTLDVWVKTRFGYVARSKEFSEELRRQSFGSFAVK